MHAYRSHTCAALTAADAGQEVRLSGWVHRVRDHGGLLFIDLRDHYGITQIIADPDSPGFAAAEALRSEYVVRIDGRVKAREPSLVNPKLPTGEIEVYLNAVTVLGAADELPLPVFGEPDYPEEIRLAYRFLDLRRETLHRNIMLRSQVVRSLRNRMWDKGFTEFQTPILTASSPEGARDFLVPSRLHPGKFYALPQAPQQFKQLIMVAGFDRYFQIAPCFRDEDPRADRSPTDFYQLDLEMSFVEQEDVFATVQPVIQGIFEEFGKGRAVAADWPRIAYKDALLWYGSDKPDLRNPIRMQVVSEHFRDGGFKPFADIVARGEEIRAIPAPKGGESNKFAKQMDAWAQKEGLPGMGYIIWRERGAEAKDARFQRIARALMPEGPNAGIIGELFAPFITDEQKIITDEQKIDRALMRKPNAETLGEVLARFSAYEQKKEGEDKLRNALEVGDWERVAFLKDAYFGPHEAAGIAKHLGPERVEEIRKQLGLGIGDAAFFLGGKPEQFESFAGRARNEIGRELELAETDTFRFAWIVDFPLYEKTDDGRIDFSHNPFSMPQGGLEALSGDPLKVLGYQYDLACNGYELLSGAIRNHQPEIMFKAFELAGYPASEVEKRFGGMVKAFRYGAPPHGGCAAGIDRIVMLLADEQNIRQVIMFPMNQQACDLMMGAPSEPTGAQLRDLGLRVNPKG